MVVKLVEFVQPVLILKEDLIKIVTAQPVFMMMEDLPVKHATHFVKLVLIHLHVLHVSVKTIELS
jgi:hypothetical protein